MLHGDGANPAHAAPIWRDAIRAAQNEEAAHGPWQLLLMWLLLPRLTGTVHRITVRLGAGRTDLESEMVLALLDKLPAVGPDLPDAAEQLIHAARASAWRYARSERRTIPSAHIEAIATRRGHPGTGVGEEADAYDFVEYALEVVPPPGPTELRAPLRFTTSSAQLEGERLGVLAKRLDLHDVVRLARRRGGRRRVGTLSLTPRRGHR
ncbi:hypothetical protein AB0L74_14085 [Streptomyces sp. NPDC052020]|uniref:hypothetical protein n=1 Tax=Streptomyces sp. NPDC052020 TaxID=3155677 RepID=UPI00341282F2